MNTGTGEMPWRCSNVKRELFELEINHRMETGQKPADAGTGLRKHGEQPPHVGQEVPHQKPITTA